VTRGKGRVFRPSRNGQIAALGAAASRSRALRHSKPCRTNVTRASRAQSARSERCGEPCTAPCRARTIPDVMAVGIAERIWAQNQRPIGPLCPEDSPDNRAPHVRLTKQRHAGRERPRRVGVGRQSQAGTGVVHAPLALPPSGRAPGGRHRTPSDRGGDTPPKSSNLGALAATTSPRPATINTDDGVADLDLQGDNLEVLTRPPSLAPLSEATREGEQKRMWVPRGLPAGASLSPDE
jgi:hypothetical protein